MNDASYYPRYAEIGGGPTEEELATDKMRRRAEYAEASAKTWMEKSLELAGALRQTRWALAERADACDVLLGQIQPDGDVVELIAIEVIRHNGPKARAALAEVDRALEVES